MTSANSANDTGEARPPILAGVRVLDLGRYVAGPFCATLLGDLGADVIRVDRIGGSEDRGLMPPPGQGDGMMFLAANRNKRSIALDLSVQEGREILARLAERSHIVVANLPPSALTKIGMDYAALQRRRADIILTSINTFGEVGPDVDKVGFDGLGQAMSGVLAISGYPGRPARAQVTYVDYAAAVAAAFGTLAAYIEWLRTGEGQHVQGSLMGAALSMMNAVILEEALCGRTRTPTGNRSPVSGPSDVYRTTDGWIIVQIVGDPLFRRWVKLVGQPGLLSDPRFVSDFSRGQHGEELSKLMSEWCATRSSAEALSALENARIPAGPVLSPRQALNYPPFQAAGFFRTIAVPEISEPVAFADAPVRLSRHQRPLSAPPRCGAHSVEILEEMEFGKAEIERLRVKGVV